MCNGASNSGASLASGSCIVRYRSFNCLQCFLNHLDHGGASRLLCSSAAERLAETARDARDYAINHPISLTCLVVAFKQMSTDPPKDIGAAEGAARKPDAMEGTLKRARMDPDPTFRIRLLMRAFCPRGLRHQDREIPRMRAWQRQLQRTDAAVSRRSTG